MDDNSAAGVLDTELIDHDIVAVDLYELVGDRDWEGWRGCDVISKCRKRDTRTMFVDSREGVAGRETGREAALGWALTWKIKDSTIVRIVSCAGEVFPIMQP